MRRTKQLGRYHVMDRIAYGGMAEIYRGVTFDVEGSERWVAIKKVLPHFAEDREFIDMLIDEAKLVGHLRHPNIAEIYEFTHWQDEYFIAMEHVDGKDLRSTMEKARSRGLLLDLDDAVYILARALDGIHHAHLARDERNEPLRIVHRDFSPSNILVSYDGQAKICDFGIAKATLNRVQTKTGIIKGKVKYMSPEQAFGRRLDHRSDIFSAGSVLYELATGVAPFSAPNEIDLIFQVREAAPRPCRDVNPQIPAHLGRIVEKGMARSRSARYQTAQEFRDALLGFLRAANPKYRRTKLSRFLKALWAAEIEHELRALEEYILDDRLSGDFGQNLIAASLGADAPFTKFTPNPGGTHGREGGLRQSSAPVGVHEVGTQILRQQAALRERAEREQREQREQRGRAEQQPSDSPRFRDRPTEHDPFLGSPSPFGAPPEAERRAPAVARTTERQPQQAPRAAVDGERVAMERRPAQSPRAPVVAERPAIVPRAPVGPPPVPQPSAARPPALPPSPAQRNATRPPAPQPARQPQGAPVVSRAPWSNLPTGSDIPEERTRVDDPPEHPEEKTQVTQQPSSRRPRAPR
ncbi:MAG: protein kinase [Deltaproteobacteria bacterium]|nr:protein kinase [Deltaproteobacteria bacterium]